MKQKIVIKLGGSSLQNEETITQLATLVRGYQKRRYHVVIVHGGGPAINAELERRGIQWQFIKGQRQTTAEMMSVIDEVLSVQVNGQLVRTLRQENIAAVGLSGAQDRILLSSKSDPELMQVGKVEKVFTETIEQVLCQFGGKVPVIAPIGFDEGGCKYNVNADWAATQIAIALRAKKLIFLTDQSGILDAERNLVSRASLQMIDQMITDGVISGGMLTKVRAMILALESDIKKVCVLHASFASQILGKVPIGTLLTDIRKRHVAGVLNERAS